VSVITYGTDVAPHLKRAMMYRRLRMQRWRDLHKHDHDRDGEFDPYSWAERAPIFDLLIGTVVLAYFLVADSAIFKQSKPVRLKTAPGH
jgi:hypothetical protein